MTKKPLFPSPQQKAEMEKTECNYLQVDEDSHYFENWEQLREYLKGSINFAWLRKAVDNTIERQKND